MKFTEIILHYYIVVILVDCLNHFDFVKLFYSLSPVPDLPYGIFGKCQGLSTLKAPNLKTPRFKVKKTLETRFTRPEKINFSGSWSKLIENST